MIKIFKPRYSKWTPLGSYNFSSDQYIVFVRKNIKTGMMSFKSKKCNPSKYNSLYFPLGLIDVKKAWEQATKEA